MGWIVQGGEKCPGLDALQSKEAKIQKLKSAYRAENINAEQLDRAIKEVEEGRESKELGNFLKGEMSAQTFGKVY